MTDTAADAAIPAPIFLQPPGGREVVDAARAEEIVSHWRSVLLARREEAPEAVLCDRISLTNKSYTADAATIVANFLSSPFKDGPSIASGIIEADLSDMIAGRMTEEGLFVLKTICDAFAGAPSLKGVNLNDNAVGEQGIGACRTVLTKPTLECLSMGNNGLALETMRQVADILTTQTPGLEEGETVVIARNLTKVHFFDNMSGPAGCTEFARILSETSRLVDVRFSGTRAGREGTAIVVSALEAALSDGRNPDLSLLELNDNHFSDGASGAISRALESTANLTCLKLCDNELEDDGTKRVCQALIDSGSFLVHLDIGGNEISRVGARFVAKYLRNSGERLKVLRLNDNELTSRGVVELVPAFRGGDDGSAIEEVELNCIMCGDIGGKALIDAYGPEGRGMPSLKKILLNGNSFSDKVLEELEAVFGDKLGVMDENDPEMDFDGELSDEEDEVDELAAAMADTKIV